MSVEALTMVVVDILGKYVVDHGATLLEEAGQAGVQVASQLCTFVLSKLKSDPAEARNAARFEENPAGYQAPLADAIAEKLASDPDFSAQLMVLIREYKQAATAVQESSNAAGSGAIAMQGSIAAGAGGVAVGGNVRGNVFIKNTQKSYSSERGNP